MSGICLVDSDSCARASRSLQMHRGYWHQPRYFDSKLPCNYIHTVILGISLERVLGSGLCKTSCTMLKKVKKFTRATPIRSKIPNVVQSDMQIRVALCSSFGPKFIWTATRAPRPTLIFCCVIPYGMAFLDGLVIMQERSAHTLRPVHSCSEATQEADDTTQIKKQHF